MYAANSHVIRRATNSDAIELRRLAASTGAAPLERPILIGQIAGRTVAAISLVDLRTIADPSQSTDRLTQTLILRARGANACREMPSLRDRLIAYLPSDHRDRPEQQKAA